MMIKELYLGKILKHLPDIIAKKTEDKRKTTQVLKQLILSVYELLDTTPDKRLVNSIKQLFRDTSETSLRKKFQNKEIKFNIIVEPFVQIPFENIKEVAEMLELPLDERVYIPALKTWTKKPVPVGIQYVSALEQLASDYESLRSDGKYRRITGQPLKGKSNRGGQSVGNLDVYNLITLDSPTILEELMTARSDDFRSKRHIISEIEQNGKAELPENTGGGTTRRLYSTYMTAMGLKPTY